jgi:hypothetical protein
MKVTARENGTTIEIDVKHMIALRQEGNYIVCYRRGTHSCVSKEKKIKIKDITVKVVKK